MRRLQPTRPLANVRSGVIPTAIVKLTAIRAPNKATVDVNVFALLEASVGVAVGAGVEYVEVVLFCASTPVASIKVARRRRIAIKMKLFAGTIAINLSIFFLMEKEK